MDFVASPTCNCVTSVVFSLVSQRNSIGMEQLTQHYRDTKQGNFSVLSAMEPHKHDWTASAPRHQRTKRVAPS